MKFLPIFALVVFLASPAWGLVNVGVECDETATEFQVTGSVFNQMVDGDVTGWEVVLEQTWVGTCETPTLVAAWGLPPFLTEEPFAFTLPVPAWDQFFFYVAKLRSPGGVIQDIPCFGTCPWASALCGEAPASRGYLVASSFNDYYDVLPCENACPTWLCQMGIDLSQVPPEQYLPFVGTGIPVDIFADYILTTPMPGSPCLFATDVRATVDGACEPIPEGMETWGSLKARFR